VLTETRNSTFLSQFYSVYSFTPYLSEINFNIIFPSMSNSPKWSHSLVLYDSNYALFLISSVNDVSPAHPAVNTSGGEEHNLGSSPLCSISHPHVTVIQIFTFHHCSQSDSAVGIVMAYALDFVQCGSGPIYPSV
jgi:hypothetical protein